MTNNFDKKKLDVIKTDKIQRKFESINNHEKWTE